ncbi:chemotaxis protein CheB [Flammeovirgaceae bacterium SG7u.111]|nr:chemotaxis protein CheB [Flammeovirgaceae bacterium SG7u.132]WPO34738.1 chemotaxis protein CheB [Flammeovirgaceae bacterium SG7u.111]
MRFKLHNKYKAIAIGGSAGSFQPITKILASLPKDFPLPIFLCLHRLKHVRHGFVEALTIKSVKPVSEPYDKEMIKRGLVYLAPANYHMSIELGNSFSLTTEELVNNSRPAIDITLESAAYAYRDKLIGILLSGANKDGAYGMKRIKERGGTTVIQDPEESMINTMPSAAQAMTQIDYVLQTDQIIKFLLELDKQFRIA